MSREPQGPTGRIQDNLLSIALPLAVIGLGIALSLGGDGLGEFLDYCVGLLG